MLKYLIHTDVDPFSSLVLLHGLQSFFKKMRKSKSRDGFCPQWRETGPGSVHGESRKLSLIQKLSSVVKKARGYDIDTCPIITKVALRQPCLSLSQTKFRTVKECVDTV